MRQNTFNYKRKDTLYYKRQNTFYRAFGHILASVRTGVCVCVCMCMCMGMGMGIAKKQQRNGELLEDTQDAFNCRSLSVKEPRTIGLFSGND